MNLESFQVTKQHFHSALANILLITMKCTNTLAKKSLYTSCIWFFCPPALCKQEPSQVAFSLLDCLSDLQTELRSLQCLHGFCTFMFSWNFVTATLLLLGRPLPKPFSPYLIKSELRSPTLKSQQFWCITAQALFYFSALAPPKSWGPAVLLFMQQNKSQKQNPSIHSLLGCRLHMKQR